MYPMHLWFHLLQQAQIMLNLLGPLQSNPNISAYNVLEGIFILLRHTWYHRALKLFFTKNGTLKIMGPRCSRQLEHWTSHRKLSLL